MLRQQALVAGVLAILLTAILNNAPGCPEWVHDPTNAVKGKGVRFVRFVGGDQSTVLTGKLYHPTSNKAPPVIVLAHGIGLSQDCSLDGFVKAFIDAGFAAFTFDYATFGASEGSPRHDIIPSRQIADLRAAIDEIQKNDSLQVDKTKIGLWGYSFGGGHVLVAAASQNPSIRAVVALAPNLASGVESVLRILVRSPVVGTKGVVNILHATIKWLAFQIIGKTWYMPLHGPPGSSAMLQNMGDDEGYSSLIVPGGGNYGWRNAATVSSALRVLIHRPINNISPIRAPTLLIGAEKDTLCPAKKIVEAAKIVESAELIILPGIGHFDLFYGDAFKSSISSTTNFFQRHLN